MGLLRGRIGPLFGLRDPCYIVVYLQNMSLHRVLGDKTPENDFFRKKPKVGHFRIVGCLIYSHVPSEKRKKIEPMT
jgi:hypothetical protein